MTRIVATLNNNGWWRVVYTDRDKVNPWRVVLKYWHNCGWHTKTVEKYANLESAMLHLAMLAKGF